MYAWPDTQQLSEEKQRLSGLTEVSVLRDTDMNAVVKNNRENGLLAGDRIRSRRKSANDPTLVFSFTDDHNAVQSVRLAEARRANESATLETRLGELTTIALTLPSLEEADAETRDHYRQSLERITNEDRRVISPDKKAAAAELEQALEWLDQRGLEIKKQTRSRILVAAVGYSNRDSVLAAQKKANQERKAGLDYELGADHSAKETLRKLASEIGRTAISDDEELFLKVARERQTKPGVLTVNNAWFRRQEKESWKNYIYAQDGWENLYGLMMRPMSQLAREKIGDLKTEGSDAVFGRHALTLASLYEVISLSKIGGDYDVLAGRLQQQLFRAGKSILDGDFSDMRKAAIVYRKELQYRVQPDDDPLKPPPQWYSGLPAKPPRKQRQEVIDDPFHGLTD